MTVIAQSKMVASDARLAAGIVVFEPDPAILKGLIAAVSPHVQTVLVFVNALSDCALRGQLERMQDVALIESPVNFGVGEALNIIVLSAALAGCSRVILFDQDSRPGDAVVSDLVSRFDDLVRSGEQPAVVGPILVPPQEGAYKPPRYFRRAHRRPIPDLRPVQFLPTSGSLISIDAFRKIGAFRGDYFIDGIDLEWCFRAWDRGYSCWCADRTEMPHSVGEGVYQACALGVQTPRQREFRYETYVRNTVYGFRLRHIPLTWKIRQAVYLVLQFVTAALATGFRLALLKRFVRGAVDGVRGRLGPPEGALFT